MSEQKIKIGITQGDTNGIGFETIVKTFLDPRVVELYTPVVYGSSKAAAFYKKEIPEAEQLLFHSVRSAQQAQAKQLNLVPLRIIILNQLNKFSNLKGKLPHPYPNLFLILRQPQGRKPHENQL